MTKLLDFVPPRFRHRTLEAALTSTFGRPFDQWRAMVGNRARYLDPEGAPSEWVTWLLSVLGFERVSSLSDRRRRELLAVAMRVWREKQVVAGIQFYLQALTGIEAEIEAVNTHAFIAGFNLAGDICGPGANAYRFQLLRPSGIPPGATLQPPEVVTDEELQWRLRLVVPAFSEYRICIINGSCGDWVTA